MKSFCHIRNKAKNIMKKPRVVVACPYDNNIVRALSMAVNEDLCSVTVVGNSNKVHDVFSREKADMNRFDFIEKNNEDDAIKEAYQLLLSDSADIFMKGLVQTKNFMKTIISDKTFIKSDLLTHVSIFHIPGLDKLLFVTDPSILIEPTVRQKLTIVKNAIELAQYLDIEQPKVAIISSTEQVDSKIKSSVDAEELMNLFNNENSSAHVYGPLALDNAVSQEAASIKKINSIVAGNADILVMPNLDTGNILSKGLTYLAGFECAGIVVGAKKPIVLTSRSADAKERFNSLAIACVMADKCN